MLLMRHILTRILVLTSLMHVTACSSVGYLLHTSSGHLELMSQRQPIESYIAEENTSAEEKLALAKILRMREFASQVLLLPDNKSYSTFVSLDREYVTWAVFAARPLSLDAKTWCFWVVGCVPYRGYFAENKALQFATQLHQQGYETYVAPIPAYSTLGWFSDPVLSSMLNRGELAMAEYIFHELAHQKLYLQNDASFNEAFATAVGQIGVQQWLAQENNIELLEKYNQSIQAKSEIYRMIDDLRTALKAIYASTDNEDSKIQSKRVALNDYQHTVTTYLKKTHRYQQYKPWLLDNINNAKLNAFSTYRDLVPNFLALFERCNRDLATFYRVVEGMRKFDKQQRIDHLNEKECS